ncbi:hypothetical protein GCM10010448_44460 [Streptomyces glomeratus]|uniref:Uncharacterized protein n=1 Tax=Streptomyces glomeratus TaxID=284452 RepID=A0ABP6LVA3_9ACTN
MTEERGAGWAGALPPRPAAKEDHRRDHLLQAGYRAAAGSTDQRPRRHPKIAALGPAELHRRQIEWHADWEADFQAFLRRKGDTEAVVDGARPLREAAAHKV